MLATSSPRASGTRDQGGGPHLRARRLRLLLALAGLAVPVGVVAFYLQRLALSPLDGLWYGFSLVSGGHVATATALAGCLFLGLVPSVAMVLVAAARQRPPEPPPEAPKVSVRGPASYAGPGSLGGTESALRR